VIGDRLLKRARKITDTLRPQ